MVLRPGLAFGAGPLDIGGLLGGELVNLVGGLIVLVEIKRVTVRKAIVSEYPNSLIQTYIVCPATRSLSSSAVERRVFR